MWLDSEYLATFLHIWKGTVMDISNITIDGIVASLQQLLNEHPISTDSIEGWILIFLIGFVAWNIYRKALKFAIWSCSVILLIQVGYYLSATGLNDIIPLSAVFKYDILTAIAQTCVAGTWR